MLLSISVRRFECKLSISKAGRLPLPPLPKSVGAIAVSLFECSKSMPRATLFIKVVGSITAIAFESKLSEVKAVRLARVVGSSTDILFEDSTS